MPITRNSSHVSKIDTFRSRLQIDRDNLDQCVIDQPDLFFEIAEQATSAVSRRDELKLNLEQMTAELTKQFREKLERERDKVTMNAVAAEVENSQKIRSLRADLLNASSEAGRWNALREACDQRRDMLKTLAQLYASQYFTRSSVNAARGSVADARAETARRVSGEERRKRM